MLPRLIPTRPTQPLRSNLYPTTSPPSSPRRFEHCPPLSSPKLAGGTSIRTSLPARIVTLRIETGSAAPQYLNVPLPPPPTGPHRHQPRLSFGHPLGHATPRSSRATNMTSSSLVSRCVTRWTEIVRCSSSSDVRSGGSTPIRVMRILATILQGGTAAMTRVRQRRIDGAIGGVAGSVGLMCPYRYSSLNTLLQMLH